MNKTVLGIVIALALLVVGGFFYFYGKDELATTNDTPSTATNSENETESLQAEENETSIIADGNVSLEGDMIDDVIITYTDSGFEPKSATVNSGQTVRFMNQSSRGMWIGSDQHPTHTAYPEKSASDCLGSSFDTCKSLPAGQSWSFTFTSEGSWGYHNHVQASHRGSVVVE